MDYSNGYTGFAPNTIYPYPGYHYTQVPNQPVPQPMNYQNTTRTQPMPQTIQNAGFISVKSRTEAEQWPLEPGASLTFKDESKPYQYYAKSRGMSQFDEPVFESYHLVKDDDNVNTINLVEKPEAPGIEFVAKEELDKLCVKIDQLADQIDRLQAALYGGVSYEDSQGGMTNA